MSDHIAPELDRLRIATGRRMRGIANLTGVSRGEIAKAVGVSETIIARVMKGSSELSVSQAVLAARFLRVSLAVLCGEEDPAPGSLTRRR